MHVFLEPMNFALNFHGEGRKSHGLDKTFHFMSVTALTFLFSSTLACSMAGGLYFASFTDQVDECMHLTI